MTPAARVPSDVPLFLFLSPIETAHLRRALTDHVGRHGRDRVPASLVTLTDALCRQSPPSAAARVVDVPGAGDAALMSYREAAQFAGVSTRTVSRWVASGQLRKVGRRVPRAALDRLVAS